MHQHSVAILNVATHFKSVEILKLLENDIHLILIQDNQLISKIWNGYWHKTHWIEIVFNGKYILWFLYTCNDDAINDRLILLKLLTHNLDVNKTIQNLDTREYTLVYTCLIC